MANAGAVTELISAYGTYADVGDLNVEAASAPPATTPVCLISSVSIVSATIVTN